MVMNISLGQTMEDFIRQQVKSGLYSSANQVMYEALEFFMQMKKENFMETL